MGPPLSLRRTALYNTTSDSPQAPCAATYTIAEAHPLVIVGVLVTLLYCRDFSVG